MSNKQIDFDVSAAEAYDYLIDPLNRAAWQSSLRRVEDVEGEDGVVGQTWTDVTLPGLRPRMELTEAVRPERWAERGTWRGVEATLTLLFHPTGKASCRVEMTMDLAGAGLLSLPMKVLDKTAPYAVASDLKRAAGILAARQD